MERLEEIHNNLINGNHSNMCDQIDDYGVGYFWSDYINFLTQIGLDMTSGYFVESVIIYHRIQG